MKNDYFKIVYQLLKYLYNCLRNSEKINLDVFNCDLYGIDEQYWNYIISNLNEERYINGVVEISVMGSLEKGVKILPIIQITPKGIQYLEGNSMFHRIKNEIKDIAGVISI